MSAFTAAFHKEFIKDTEKYDIFSFDHKLLKEVQKDDKFVGTTREYMRATSLMGGYGFGDTMPRTNPSKLISPTLDAKKFYARAILDTESIAAAMSAPEKGAFVELVNRVKVDINRAIQNGLSLALLCGNADNELVLGVGDGATSVTGSDPYVMTLASDTNMYRFHPKQIVTIEDGNTDLFEVTAVDRSAKTITVGRLTGSQVPANTDEVFLQGGDGGSFIGLPAATAASGTLHGVSISVNANWGATRDTSGGSIDEHRLFDMILDIENLSGAAPNLIVCSIEQYKKLAAGLSDKRLLTDMSDAMGHRSLAITHDRGPVRIIWDRLMKADEVYVLNTKFITLVKRPMDGMATVGGDLLMPDYINDQDRYIITYRLYANFFIEPTYQGVFDGLDL